MLIPAWQRLIGICLYMLPWIDALPFGSNLFMKFEFLKILILPALPIIFIQGSIPFGKLFLFLILFIGVVRNNKISYFIRFNTLQALLINIIVIIAGYSLEILLRLIGNNIFFEFSSNIIFIFALAVMIFTVIESLQGNEPDLPGVTTAVRLQI